MSERIQYWQHFCEVGFPHQPHFTGEKAEVQRVKFPQTGKKEERLDVTPGHILTTGNLSPPDSNLCGCDERR